MDKRTSSLKVNENRRIRGYEQVWMDQFLFFALQEVEHKEILVKKIKKVM
jgi:hypothetical protein